MNENLDIFICTHCDFNDYPHNDVYKIIAGENDLKNIYSLKTYAEKDTKYTHIQKYVNEFTRMYWVRYNLDLKEYIGFCHYSRYFNFYENVPNISELFNNCDIITNDPINWNMRDQYARYHNVNDYDLIKEIIISNYDISLEEFSTYENNIYPCNLYIMKQDDFIRYINFVSNIIDEFIKIKNFDSIQNIENFVMQNWNLYNHDVTNVTFQSRIIAFLIERITTIYYKKYHNNILEIPMIMKNDNTRNAIRKIYY